jgi:hypothetical protein
MLTEVVFKLAKQKSNKNMKTYIQKQKLTLQILVQFYNNLI